MRALAAIFILALGLRLAVVSLGIGYDREMVFWDARDYDHHAMSLIAGRGFTNGVSYSSRPPLYPFLLAGAYLLFGHHYYPIRLLQSLLDAFGILILFFINKHFFPERVCFLTAIFCAVHPILVFYCGNILTETTSLFLLSLVVLALLRSVEKSSFFWAAATGFLFGFLLLTKNALLPFFPFMVLWVLIGHKGAWAIRLKMVATVTFCIGLTLLPWTLRNYKIHHAFVPITTSMGLLWETNNPKALENPELIGLQADWIMVGNVFKEEGGKRIRLSEVEGDRYLARRAVAFQKELLKTQPRKFFGRLLRKFFAAWSFHPGQHPIEYFLFFLAYGLALGGVIVSLKNGTRPLLHYFLILQYVLISLVYYGRAKYRVPIEPYVITFTALALDRLWILTNRAYRVMIKNQNSF